LWWLVVVAVVDKRALAVAAVLVDSAQVQAYL
jgi:hypothetical protein